MSNKSFSPTSSLGPGSRTRRKMSGDKLQPIGKNKVKEFVQDMLIVNGHKELLKRILQSHLVQSGWTYAMRMRFTDYIKQKGIENVNVSHMIAELIPKGVETFPEAIRQETEETLWNYATEFISIDDSCTPPQDEDPNGYQESYFYQSKDVKPDPGIGYNVPTPEMILSRSPSPSSLPRPLTPQFSQHAPPVLKPEIKEEPEDESEEGEEDEEMGSNADENENEENEEEDDDQMDDEGDEDLDGEPQSVNNHVDSEEEELMDV